MARASTPFTHVYAGKDPLMDRRRKPSDVPRGFFTRLWGVDGRFTGALRRFPGFEDVLDLKAAPFDGSTGWITGDYSHYTAIDNDTIPLDEIWFFKYLTVRTVGASDATDEVVRGIQSCSDSSRRP